MIATRRDLILFSTLLGNILKLNRSVNDAVGILAQETDHWRLRRLCGAVHTELGWGKPLSEALAAIGAPLDFRRYVQAGERSGSLPNVLLHYAARMEARRRNAGQFITLSIYPLALLIVTGVVFVLLNAIFIPVVPPEFLHHRANLVGAALHSFYFSLLARQQPLRLALLAGLALVVLAWRLKRLPPGRWVLDHLLLILPLGRTLVWNEALADFCYLAGELLRRRLPVTEGFTAALAAVPNAAIRHRLRLLTEWIVRNDSRPGGGPPARVPVVIIHVMRWGMLNENLPEVLLEMSEVFSESNDEVYARFLTVYQPVLTLVVGLIVGLVVMMFFGTYFNFVYYHW